MTQQRLMRSNTDKIVAGVCGGLAQYFAVDPIFTRLIMVALVFAGVVGVLIYPLLWLIMPVQTDMATPTYAQGQNFDPQTGQSIRSPVHIDQRQRMLGLLLVGVAVVMFASMFPHGGQVVLALAFLLGGGYILHNRP